MSENKNNSESPFFPSGETPYFIKEVESITKKVGEREIKKRTARTIGKFFTLVKKRIKGLIIKANITNRCGPSLKTDKEKDIPVSLFENSIKELKKYGFRNVFFVGGEPIFHPEFEKLVKLTCDYKYHYNVRINDPFLYQNYWQVIEKYKDFCSGINLNLDGANAEVCDQIRKKEGSFKKLIEAINFYIENNLPVTITTYLNKKNLHQIREITSLCESLRVTILRYAATSFPPSEENILSDEEKEKCIETIKEIYKIKTTPLKIFIGPELLVNNPQGIDFCRNITSLRRLNINYDGRILFCGRIYKQYQDQPSIKKQGILKCLENNINIANEIRKQRLKDLNQNIYFEGFNSCEYCNKYIEKITKKLKDENKRRRNY